MKANEFLAQWTDGKPYFEARTSGSTGEPKIIQVSKKDALISARATNTFFNLGKDSRFVCPMDFRYIGAKMMAVRAMDCRGTLVEVEPSNNFTFDGTADLLAIVPSQIECLVNSEKLCAQTKNVIIGGAPLTARQEELMKNSGLNAFVTYGMTETISHVALRKINNTVYTALPSITFSLDTRGCLVIHMEGRDVDRIVTNDVVRLLSDTQFEWLTRFDNIINSGGVKIFPRHVESLMSRLLTERSVGFTTLLCVGVPSERWGHEVVCVIKNASPWNKEIEKSLIGEAKRQCTHPYHYPHRIINVDELPETENGKYDYGKIKSLISSVNKETVRKWENNHKNT